MLIKRIPLILISFSALVLLIVADRKNMLRLTKIECIIADNAKGIFANTSCKIKALSRYRTAINFETVILQPLDDILVHMQIFKKNSVQFLPYMVNVTVNICKFLDGSDKTSFYIQFMVGWINKYSNLNHSCPYSGHHFARNLEPFADKIPVFVPAGDYRLDLNFFRGTLKNRLISVRGYGTITNRAFIEQNN